MVLTERDKELFRKLQSYGIFTTRQLGQMIFPGVALTTVLRRLRALESGGYLQRIEGLPNAERAWALTRRSGLLVPDRAAKLHFPRHSLYHDLKLTTLRLRLEDSGLAHSWIPEHEIKARIAEKHGVREVQRRVIPDGIMGIDIAGLKESASIELELSFKNSSRYSQIFWDYRHKSNIHTLWYIVENKSIGQHLEKCFRKSYMSKPKFYWSLLEEVMQEPATAILRSTYEQRFAQDIFTMAAIPPAHLGAQSLSMGDDSEKAAEHALSPENSGENLAS